MAVIKVITRLLFCTFLLFICNEVNGEHLFVNDAVLEFLNSNPNRVYDYRRGRLLDVQYRGEVIEASIEIEAVCNGWYPEILCNDQMLTCHAYLGQSNVRPGLYEVLSDVRCTPKSEGTVEEVDEVRNVPLSFAEQSSQGKLDLSHEALPPEQERADFIAVRKDSFPCPGCPFDLDKKAVGVDELIDVALKHIESERAQRHKITNVRRIQEQVVAGIKYILEADVAQTTCGKDADLLSQCPLDASVEPFICEVTFLQQPWISRVKRIIKNNCTISQIFEISDDRNDSSNEILPEKDDTSNTNIRNIPLTDRRLTDVESQIVSADDLFEAPKNAKQSVQESSPSIQQIKKLNVEPLMVTNDRPELRTLYVSMPVVDEVEPIVLQNDQPEQIEMHDLLIKDLIPREEMFKRQVDAKKASSEEKSKSNDSSEEKKKSSEESKSNSSSSEEQTKVATEQTTNTTGNVLLTKREVKPQADSSEEISKNKSEDSSEEDEKKRNKRAAYLTVSDRSERSIGQLEKVPSEEKVIVRDLADFAANTLDNKDDDNHKRVILQILGAKKLKLDGIYYQIILRLGISHCQEHEHHDSCRENLFTNLTKICKVQVHVDDDYSNPKMVKSQCQNIKKDENDRNRTNYSRYRRQLVGGHSPLDKNHPTIKKFLGETLDYVDSVSDQPNKHKTVEILSATSQVVAGAKYVISFKIGVTKCPKTHKYSAENCELLEGSEPEVCNVSIWDRPWLNKTLYTLKCKDKVYNFGQTGRSRTERDVNGYDFSPKDVMIDALNDLSNKDATFTYAVNHWKFTDVYPLAWNPQYLNTTHDVSICHKSTNSCLENVIGTFTLVVDDKLFNGLTVTISFSHHKGQHTYRTFKYFESSPDLQRVVFKQFVATFGKNYKNKNEYRYRFKVFRDNLKKIEMLNRNERGTAIYTATEFADLTEEEFSRGHGYRPDLRNENELPFTKASIPDVNLPIEFDWRNKGAVTAVKNQGFCGSCWAFSVTGNVEGQYAIKHGKLLEFSEQELVDCDKVDQGCNGGLMDNAYRAIEKLGGLEPEDEYPYEGVDETCHFNVNKVEVQLTGAVNISQNETDMAKWLVANGPISIAINANGMQFYMGGVSHPYKFLCSPTNLDHGVLIVGYGVHKYSLFNKTLPYWIVKNSWGQSWGEQGYYRVYRGDGTCGLNQTPSSALVA